MLRLQPVVSDRDSSRCSWESIVGQVAAGSPLALETLYHLLSPLRFEIAGRVDRSQIDDLYHDTIVALIDAIQSGLVRVPEALPTYARTIIKRRFCRWVGEMALARASVDPDAAALRDRSLNPEQRRIWMQQREIAGRILGALPARERDMLARFYLKQESPAEIRRAMQLTPTQFRLLKSRALARFAERGRAHIAGRANAALS
jgi:RNA polymerase sigma-70 factor, ECF subfamily